MIDVTPVQNDPPLQTLVGQLRELIRDARAEYGKRLLPRLAESLTEEFGRGFDATNLRHISGWCSRAMRTIRNCGMKIRSLCMVGGMPVHIG